MRRLPPRGPLVALAPLTGLVLTLTGCEADAGTSPGQTSTASPTSGASMDDADRTSATPGASPAQTHAELGAGAVLTNDDLGAVVRLSPGEEAVLRLTPPLQDRSPSVADPEVVELVPVQHFADPGYAEYELLALSPGETAVAVQGDGGAGLAVLVVVRGQ